MAADLNLTVRTITIPANGTARLNGLFDFFFCLEAAGDFNADFDGTAVEWGAGYKFKTAGRSIETIILTDTSGGANAVKYVAGSGEFDSNNLSLSGALSLSRSKNLTDAVDVSLAATSTTQILAANGNRRTALVTNLGTQTLRIGSANAGVNRGAAVAPGATIVLDTEAAVYGYNPGGAAEDVSVLEVTD